jgi:hypothetical protein
MNSRPVRHDVQHELTPLAKANARIPAGDMTATSDKQVNGRLASCVGVVLSKTMCQSVD